MLAKFVTDCLNISPSNRLEVFSRCNHDALSSCNSDGWLAAALHWKSDLSRMSELLEKVRKARNCKP